ncbi:MAG: hypothetical protein FWD32_03035 [Firmicutes bacterium]|nr:hypothetical protein [Bacillota bacterium]
MVFIEIQNRDGFYNGKRYGAIPFGDSASSGILEKVWLLDSNGNKVLLVKKGILAESLEIEGEAIFSQYAENLDLDVVKYKPEIMRETMSFKEGGNLYNVVVCANYLIDGMTQKEDYTAAKLFNIYRRNCEYESRKSGTTVVNTNSVKGYEQMLRTLYSNYDGLEKTILSVKKLAVLDYLTQQSDRHDNNTSFIIDDKNKKIRLAPIYDSGRIFSLFNYNEEKEKFKILGAERAKSNEMWIRKGWDAFLSGKSPYLGIREGTLSYMNWQLHRPHPAQTDMDGLVEFEQELASMINADDNLKSFYKKAKKADFKQIISTVEKGFSDYLDDDLADYITAKFEHRVKRLDRCLIKQNQLNKAEVK